MAKDNKPEGRKKKYEKPVNIDSQGFSFDAFVKAVSQADRNKVDERVFQQVLTDFLQAVKEVQDLPELHTVCKDLEQDLKQFSKDFANKLEKDLNTVLRRTKEFEQGKTDVLTLIEGYLE